MVLKLVAESELTLIRNLWMSNSYYRSKWESQLREGIPFVFSQRKCEVKQSTINLVTLKSNMTQEKINQFSSSFKGRIDQKVVTE